MRSRSLIPAVSAAVLGLAAAGCGTKLVPLNKRVTVAEGAAPAPNSGVIKTPFGTVVIDGQTGYRAAEDLRKSAAKHTGWEVTYLVMTSHHADHSLGNEVFRKAEIISTTASRRAFGEKAEAERKMLADRLKIGGAAGAELMPATLTFEKSMTLHAGWPKKEGAVEVRMLEMPSGAAPGNLVVYLPGEDVLFAGDLVCGGVFPYMGDADVKAWAKALDEIAALKFKTLVPGHGKTGPKERLLAETRKFLADLCAEVRKAKAAGMSLEDARTKVRLDSYAKWPARDELLPIAVERLWSQELPEFKTPAAAKPAAAPARK